MLDTSLVTLVVVVMLTSIYILDDFFFEMHTRYLGIYLPILCSVLSPVGCRYFYHIRSY